MWVAADVEYLVLSTVGGVGILNCILCMFFLANESFIKESGKKKFITYY